MAIRTDDPARDIGGINSKNLSLGDWPCLLEHGRDYREVCVYKYPGFRSSYTTVAEGKKTKRSTKKQGQRFRRFERYERFGFERATGLLRQRVANILAIIYSSSSIPLI